MPNEISLEEIAKQTDEEVKEAFQVLYDADLLTQENSKIVTHFYATTTKYSLAAILQSMRLHDILTEDSFSFLIEHNDRPNDVIWHFLCGHAHHKLMKMRGILGYPFESAGLCHGFTLRWIEACLLKEEDKFFKRVRQIILDVSEPQVLLGKINAAKAKAKKHETLTEDDISALEILAFYESILLYHSPDKHIDLFNEILTQRDIEMMSQLAASEGILKKGGLKKAYSEPCISTRNEIIDYLNSMINVIKSDPVTKNEVGFLLSSHAHAIGVVFQPESDSFIFMNISQWPPEEYKLSELNLLVDQIIQGLNRSNNNYTAFKLNVITTDPAVVAKFASKEKQKITKEIAERESEDGITLAYIAAQNGYADVIAELAQQGADLNKPNKDGETPAWIAAQNGHIKVISQLASCGVDLNRPTEITPLFMASQEGQAEVVRFLLDKNVNAHQQPSISPAKSWSDFVSGYSLDIVERMKRFIENKIQQGCMEENIPVLPNEIASIMGHEEIVKIFSEHENAFRPAEQPVFTAPIDEEIPDAGDVVVNTQPSYLVSEERRGGKSVHHEPETPSDVSETDGPDTKRRRLKKE